MRVPRVLGWIAFVWAMGFVAFCLGAPLGALLLRVFMSSGSHPEFVDLVGVWTVVQATVQQAFWSVFFSVGLGFPLGLWVGTQVSCGSRTGRACEILLGLPYGVPTVVAGLTGVLWLGRSGILAGLGFHSDWLYSLKAVILAHVFFNAPWIALAVAQARWRVAQDSDAQLEAARTLGASYGSRLRFVIWPSIRWPLASQSVQVFNLCTMSFALVLLLGGGPPVDTLETAIYSHMRFSSLDVGGAAVFALAELLINLVPWGLILYFRGRESHPVLILRGNKPDRFKNRGSRASQNLMSLGCIGACLVALLPYSALVWIFFKQRYFNSDFASEIFRPLVLSLGLALGASVLVTTLSIAAVMVGALTAKNHPRFQGILNLALALPSGVSVLVLGLGFWLAYGRWLDPFDGSFLAMVVLQATLFFPLSFRMLWPLAEAVQLPLLEAALTLGASPGRAFWLVEWPRWRGPILSSAAVVAGASLGEVAAVSLFYSEKLIPLPLLLTRWMAQYRFDQAQGLAFLILILSAGTIAMVKGRVS